MDEKRIIPITSTMVPRLASEELVKAYQDLTALQRMIALELRKRGAHERLGMDWEDFINFELEIEI